jgi:RNA polymerase sigma factor (sigma-70 family)
MVLAAGRRILGDAHDAEDVCQAAFLLLARKAASPRWQSSVANWLYQTAHLLALKVRTAAARRARREGGVAPRSPGDPLAEILGQERLAALDAELLALPEPLRAPHVLCYLEGATRDEAARLLGCPLATLKKRLERGHNRLQPALLRLGLGLPAALLGALSARQAADAATTGPRARATAQTALAVTAGKSADGVIPSRVSQLVRRGLHPMSGNKFKAALALVLVGGLLLTAGALAVRARDDQPVGTPTQGAPAAQDKNADRRAAAPVQVQGTILRYQFQEGDQYRYVVEKKTETTTTAAGNERVGSTTQIYDVTWRVTGVDSAGSARMTLTVDRVRFVMDSGFTGKVEFDSRKHKNPQGVPAGVRVLSAVLKSQVGARFTCSLSPRGEVSDFQVPKKVADVVRSTPGVQALFSAESLKQQLACQGGVVLPKDPVLKGAGWSETAKVAVAGGMPS